MLSSNIHKEVAALNLGSKAEDTTVIIPCYGEVHESLLPLTGKLSPAMIPLDGKPVIFRTVDYLLNQGITKFVIPVRKEDSLLCSFLREVFGNRATISFPIPDRDGDIGYTLLCTKPYIQTSHALIVLGDTFFNFPSDELLKFDESFVLVHPVEDVSRWCLVETDQDGYLEKLIDKPAEYQGDLLALIGVYGISQWASFIETLGEELEKSIAKGQYRASLTNTLETYSQKEKITAVRADTWFDCGHADTLLSSQRRLLQARSFNSLEFDETRGVVTKQSQNKPKFLDEIEYYQLLPKDLQVYFPRVVDCNKDWANLSVTLEYYGYPTLAESLLFEKLESRVWRAIFLHIQSIHRSFKKHLAEFPKTALEEIYLHRTESRIEELKRNAIFRSYFDSDSLKINGESILSFQKIWLALQPDIFKLIDSGSWAPIHGDLCFSNILYDLNARLCKLIDPRGSFGVRGIYGDPRYDIAKLYHSVHGLYDFIVNDLFTVSYEPNKIDFKIAEGPHIIAIQEEFKDVFFTDYSEKEISLIEGLLFTTMGVFHGNSINRQMALLATGLKILNNVVSGK